MIAKIVLILAGLSLLGACAPKDEFAWVFSPEPAEQFEAGWPYTRAPSYPYGVWTAASGFTIELRSDLTYLVCREGRSECDQGTFEHNRVAINLHDFNVPEHPLAQELITLVDSEWRRGRDLNFTPNMGPPANAESCGGMPCVQIGNYTRRGEYTFVLQSDGGQ